MRFNYLKTCLKTAVLLTAVLLVGAGLAVAQQVNLTAGPTTVALPDGTAVPMWGYTCNGATQGIAAINIVSGGTGYAVGDSLTFTGGGGSSAAATVASVDGTGAITGITLSNGGGGYTSAPVVGVNSTAGTGANLSASLTVGTCARLSTNTTGWSPIVITVAPGSLTINLTNNLPVPPGATAGVPTSLVIVGQLGGGLGDVTQRTTTLPPDHSGAQAAVTWPIAGAAGGTPPTQGNRVQSFSTEVGVGTLATGQCATNPCPLTWNNLRPGTYLIESGTHPSIQGPMGLYGILVVTTAPTATSGAETAPGCAYPGATAGTCAVPYDAEVPLVLSEIDPVQNTTVSAAVNTAGFSESAVWSGQPNGCGNPTSSSYLTCYPPAVNYTPLVYMINGVAFNKNNTSGSLFPISPATIAPATGTGAVLVRVVNAGLRMHVPAVVGSQVAGQTGATNPIVTGFNLIAEDGNPLPGVSRVQSEVFMAAGKTYDLMINGQSTSTSGTVTTITAYANALAVYDRELSLSANATARDSGMLAYIGINGAQPPVSSSGSLTPVAAVANHDTYVLTKGQILTVSDPSRGVIANDKGVYIVELLAPPTNGTVTLNQNGTFVYYPAAATTATDTFTYCANGGVTGTACSSNVSTTVTLGPSTVADSGITCSALPPYTSNVATYLAIKTPGLLAFCKDGAGLPLSLDTSSVTASGMTVLADASGGFTASLAAPGGGTHTFTVNVQNPKGQTAAVSATINFPAATGLQVTVLDGKDKATPVTDYRWIIEEDRTFYINPACTTNPQPAGCPAFGATGTTGIVPTFGTNFHTSYMPVVAAGCMGTVACESGQSLLGTPAVCDIGNGICRTDASQQTPLDPSQVYLDPTKRYYISVLPGDAANPFNTANAVSGHGMGGAQIACVPTAPAVTCTSTGAFPPVTVLVEPNPFPPAKLSVFVFQDDFPLNGEQDGGGGIDILSPNEPGLGGFEITLFDDAGGTGDATGQLTHDMFNQPLSNSLAGTIDPLTGKGACPITPHPLGGVDSTQGNTAGSVGTLGITGRIVTCPTYESDGTTLSPLAGQAVVPNMMAGRYGVVATPAADRIAKGEEWLQTNTLDGQKAHDSFLRIAEPSYFQEYGPAGYHVSIGFANPKIINSRLRGICNGADPNSPQPGTPYNCTNTVKGLVSTERMSRTPDERLYGSGDNSSFSFTQCYVSFGDPDGEDFAFTKCNSDGSFSLSGLPDGNWRVTVFDQWNDMLVDGLSTPVGLGPGFAGCPGANSSPTTCDLGQIATNQWQANIYTSTFFDQNGDGVRDNNEPGLTLVSTNIRFRDGSYSNFNNTDLNGNAGFNEVFPLFSWYVIESDSTRYKNTGTHVVYDAGGPSDGTPGCGGSGATAPAPCGSSTIANNMANTFEAIPVPTNLRVPGAFYCATADCTDAPSPLAPGGTGGSTGRVDPPWVLSEGWQGFSGQNSFLEFGKKPYVVGETGGIRGEVNYASTRPFDDPQLLLHVSWTPDVPNVTVNLYQEGFAADNITPTLTLVDTTVTSSFDKWAQGFRSDGMPNMNCPGQGTASGTNPDFFFFSLFGQPNYLDFYNSQHGGPAVTALPNNSQFKCYDGMHNWNQLQPAPYDGMYQFPSVTSINPATGRPAGTNCTGCVPNPDTSDTWRAGTPMLPAGKYVVEVVVPPGYELVKEEDKNILIGDNYIAPVTQEFGALGSIFIIPDQAAVGASYNANNAQNPTTDLGTLSLPRGEGDTGSVEQFWPCVGASRIVPDYMSIFPQSAEVSPFAGATRNLCDRKEVTLQDQTSALAKFYIFSSTHVAAHYTGVITDDYTSEFDPFSPQFGEKFSPPNLPISIKDFNGNEISRTYADHWGTYDGLNYSTWEVNPPNPTGYAPTMMVTCMNDPGPILDTRATINGVPNPTYNQMIPDPLYTPGYSQFCYEIPFMPGQTQYMDTPVVPTSAFAGAGYNNVDCSYPDGTPAIKEVDGDAVGPWLSATGALKLTITALGDQSVPNNAYSGPSATTAPYNLKSVTHHYGFGPAPAGGCSNGNPNAACPNVTVGGVPLHGVAWTDTQITGTVQATAIPACTMQQQAQYGGSAAKCGQLVITATSGKQSIDVVTVTIGGKSPTHVSASASIQSAIDAAAPGDLIIVDPTCTTTTAGVTSTVPCTTPGVTAATNTTAAHNEILIMWKPVRLQGVGAASSIVNANTHPAGKLDAWRAQVNCLFGLAINGQPYGGSNPFDPSHTFTCPGNGWNYYNPTANNPQIDRLPLEATLGWDASLNGNLAELLQEPSLMGALEGAGITVLSKGVFFPSNPFDPTLLAGFPTGTILFTSANTSTYCTGTYPSNFQCNPSSIDGLGITDSSQGGGGVFVHGWGHNLQIANNRIYSNAGTLSGGINVGQGEFAPSQVVGSATNAPPGSCMGTAPGPGISIINPSLVANQQLPYCENLNVNVHNNDISLNSSTGDELFSATPAGAGGVSFCTGSDYYKFNYNWVCGNMSSGDGGGVGHLGFIYHDPTDPNQGIQHNSIIFNQSINPTIAANGGGLVVMGTPDVDPPCGATTDTDCVPPLGSVGPSDGVGPGLVINANLIQGNSAESGSGGGIAFQHINGSEVVAFPTDPSKWYAIQFTNNIVSDNVAGWDGAGISLLDALNLNIVNNTIVSNATTASSGMLFNTLGAPLASTQGPTCTANCGTNSTPQPAGLVSQHNSAVLSANLPLTTQNGVAAVPIVTCPAGHFAPGTTANNGACRSISYPLLDNNVFWQNSAGYISVGATGPGTLNQQHVVTLHDAFTGTLAANQTSTGQCTSDRSFWDLGVRGDTGPTNHSGFTLNPLYSVLTPGSSGYSTTNITANPVLVSQYCDGSRTPPEFAAAGWAVPPGISDATVPNPLFNLTPVATVDEGNNWVNMRWGPLSLTNPTVLGTDGNYGGGAPLGNYSISTGSPAVNYVAPSSPTYAVAPTTDFFGNLRKTTTDPNVDVGAVELQGGTTAAGPTLSGITPASGVRGTSVPVTISGANLTGATAVTISGSGVSHGTFTVNSGGTAITTTFTITPGAALTSRNVTVTTPGGTSGPVAFTVTGAAVTFAGPAPALTTTPANTTTKTGLVTVSNAAAATGAFTLTAAPTVTKVGTTGGTFSVIAGGTCASGTVINPGGSCTVNVQYAPGTSTATASGHVNVTGTGAGTATVSSANFPAN
jgi:Bacterial Ig domain